VRCVVKLKRVTNRRHGTSCFGRRGDVDSGQRVQRTVHDHAGGERAVRRRTLHHPAGARGVLGEHPNVTVEMIPTSTTSRLRIGTWSTGPVRIAADHGHELAVTDLRASGRGGGRGARGSLE